MKQWLQYCSAIKLLFQQYILEKLKRWIETGKKNVKETDVGLQNQSNVFMVWQGYLKCQDYDLRKIFHWSLSLLFVILAILNFFTTSCKNFLFITMNFHSYFHEGICPLFFHIGSHLLLFRLMFLLLLEFFCQYFVVWIFKHHIFCILHH